MLDSVKMTPTQARQKHPLALAFVGDTVYDLFMRTRAVCASNQTVHALHSRVCGQVNAHAQARAAHALQSAFTQEEADIFRRGRNAKSTTVPKNMSVADYRCATGLEAVVGYLFLTRQDARLEELFAALIREMEEAVGTE